MKSCPSCGEENPDRARFCLNCGATLGGADVRREEARKVVTIVFVDVTRSTELGERLDPEALRRVMGRYFDEMAAVIARHGGTVEKFIGDAVMAVFGIPRLHEDDALRAVRAAVEMRAALDALNADLERDHGVRIAIRIGVNTGEVVSGDPSAGHRLVTGDAVNVAARLEQVAPDGDVLLGDTTYRLVRDAVNVEPINALVVKGKSEPVAAHRLVSVIGSGEGHARRLDSPMIGRAKELELMERALDRAVTERTSHLFTLLGPAGIGKSRLVQEFVAGPAASAMVLRGRCLSYGDGITFFPLLEIVQHGAGVLESDDRETARSRLAALVEGAEEARRIVPLVAGLLSWDEPGPTEEAFWAVRKLFEYLARERPVVVVVDDIQWGEPTFLDLLDHLADWTRDAALTLVCVARPELLEVRPGWAGGKINATTILLEPLDTERSSILVENLLGRAEISDAARERIVAAAEGNPLFLEEMISKLIDDGALRLGDGSRQVLDENVSFEAPPTIQLLLAARLDRLDPDERLVIECGAVEGHVFHRGAVTALSDEPHRQDVSPRLLSLTRKELIRPASAEFPGEDAFRFRHLLIRDAAYNGVPKELRADLHERFATWLGRVVGERITEYEEILAYHLEQAFTYRTALGPADERTRAIGRQAGERLLAAADRAEARGDYPAARGLAERGVSLLEGASQARCLVVLARALQQLPDYVEAEARASDAAAIATKSGDRRLALHASLAQVGARLSIDPTYTFAGCRAEVEAIQEEFASIGDVHGAIDANIMLSQLAFWEGRCHVSRKNSEKLADDPDTLTPRQRIVVARQLTHDARFGSAPVDESFALVDRARRLLGDSLWGGIVAGTARTTLFGMVGSFEKAREEAARTESLYLELGLPGMAATHQQDRGHMELLAGRADEAERIFRRMHAIYEEIRETAYHSTIAALLARALCDQNRFDEAERYTDLSRGLAAKDDFGSHVEWRMAAARLASSRGLHDEAIQLAQEAVALCEPTDYLVMQGDSHEVLGMVLVAAGRDAEGHAALEHALERFERKGVIPAIARLRDRLKA